MSNINYDNFVELDDITLEDCLDLYKKNIFAIINDGRIINLMKDGD